MKFGLIFATMLSTAVFAQPPMPATPAAAPETSAMTLPPPTPPDAAPKGTNATTRVKKSLKKKVATKKSTATTAASTTLPASMLATNEPAVAVKNNVVVRGQAHINSEIVGHLKKGDTVTVLEIVTLKHPGVDEPANWARIALPADMHAWVNTSFIDASNQTVSARKLNLRTGPGENYSVIGRLQKGDSIKTVTTKGGWTQIEPSTNTFAFVAAHLLSHKEAEATPATPPVVATAPIITPPTPVTPTVINNGNPIAGPATGAPGTVANNVTPLATTPPVTTPIVSLPPVVRPVRPVVQEVLVPRIVEREGIVGGTVSIQAPSHYELKSLDDGNTIDYLYSSSTNLVLKRYKGLVVHVTGEEELDERWPNTPVITIKTIQQVK